MADDRTTTNSTLLRAIAVLESVAEANRATSAADLVEFLKLPKPTVHRLVHQLLDERLLQREPSSKRLIPGPRLTKLAFDVLANAALAAPRRAILQALSEELGETCNISVLDGDRQVYFDRVETNWPIRVQLQPGSRLPLHCTASGKLFLSQMPLKLRQTVLTSTPLVTYTDHTITDPAALDLELRRIAAESLSTDNEEFMAGMVAIAVPVYDAAGRVCATVAAHAPTVRKPLDELRKFVPALRRAALALSVVLEEQTTDTDRR
jgi:DNA-binding IclR family transcriptional regulator